MASFSFTSPVTPTADSRLSDDYLLVQQMSIAQDAVTGLSVAAAPAPVATPTCQLAILSGLAGPTPVELRVSDATPYCYNTIPLPTKGTGPTEIVCCGVNPGGLNALVCTSAGVEIMTLDDTGTWSSPSAFTASSYLTAAGLDPFRMFTAVVIGLTGDGNAMMYSKPRSSGVWGARALDFGHQLVGARCRMQVMRGTYQELGWLCFTADGQNPLRVWTGSGDGDPQSDPVRVNVAANDVLYTCAQPSSVLALFTDAGESLWSVLMSYDMQILDLQKVGSNVKQGAGFLGDNGLVRFYACDSVGNLSILVQTGWDSDNYPVWASSPFPLDNDAIFVTAAKGVGGANTLGVVRVDQTTIDFLTEPNDQGFWTRVPVIGPEPTVPMNITRYRTRVALTDANGLPCSGMAVQLTPSELVCLEVGGQNVVASPASPASLTADATGAVTFSQPAVGLTAATFTLAGEGITGALEISPFDYINANLAGEQPIFTGSTTLPPLQDGATLLNATVSGQPLLPPAVTAQQADVVVQAINGLYAVVNGTMPCDGFSVDLSDPGNPSYQCVSADELLELRASLPGDIWNDIDDVLGDIWHGIKQAAAVVVKFTVDTAEKVISISLQIGADLIVLLTDLSLDIDPVASITPALFSWLGVPAATLLNWLKDLLPWDEIWATMETFNGYLVNGLASLQNITGKAELLTQDFFQSLQQQIDGAFAYVKANLGDQTLSVPHPVTGATGPPVMMPGSDATNHWLLDKLRAHLPGTGFLLNPGDPTTFLAQVKTSFENSNIEDDIAAGVSALQSFFSTLWSNGGKPADLSQERLIDLIDAAQALVDAVLSAVNLLVETFLDLVEYAVQASATCLQTALPDIPFMTWLWESVLRPPDSEEAMTLGKLCCLGLAVPVTIASKLSPVRNPPSGQRIRAFPAARDAADDDGVVTAQVWTSIVLAFIDCVNDVMTGAANAVPAVDLAPDPFVYFWNWFDFVANFVVQVLFWPGNDPFNFDIESQYQTLGEKIVFWTWVGYFVPICFDGACTALSTGLTFNESGSRWQSDVEQVDTLNLVGDTVLGYVLAAAGVAGTTVEVREQVQDVGIDDIVEAWLGALPWATQYVFLSQEAVVASDSWTIAAQAVVDVLGDVYL